MTADRAIHRLRWSTPDPAAVADRLRHEGIEPRGGAFRLGPLVVWLAAGPADRLAVDDDTSLVDAEVPVAPGWAALAIAWATVDLERAVAQLGAAQLGAAQLGAAQRGVAPIDRRPRDGTLGASVALAARLPVPVVLLEPDTEGRLAAMLARHGEGPVGLYAVRAGVPIGGFPDRGPFGRQRLLSPSPTPWAPVLIGVEPPRSGRAPAATIRP